MAAVVPVALSLCASAGAVKKEYSYTGMNGASHNIEVYFPENHKPGVNAPCFVFFHGGGWTNGDLDQGRPICEYLASRGMVALTANYSMLPKDEQKNLPAGESKKRICVMDGKTVVRWVKQHANELGIDPGKIVVSGASAGGHIGVLQMMDEEFNNPADSTEIHTDAQAFVLLCPAFTVPERDQAPDVNVFQWVEKKFPPTLFIVGDTDSWKKASDVLVEKLAEKKNDFEVWMGPGVGHMFFRTAEWITPTLIRIDEFLSANGFLKGKTTLQPAENGRKLERIMAAKQGEEYE
jgi:acetyl esterase/lipase